jgi:hypothetical protein
MLKQNGWSKIHSIIVVAAFIFSFTIGGMGSIFLYWFLGYAGESGHQAIEEAQSTEIISVRIFRRP